MPQDTAEQIVAQSGNNLHCKVANFFRNAGWRTRIGQYYVDASTEKSRELDLIVEKSWKFNDQPFGSSTQVVVRLVIECKYIRDNETIVFWFDTKDEKEATEWVNANTPLSDNNIYRHEHHYLKNSPHAAKLFASASLPQTDNEAFFRALNQVLNGHLHVKKMDLLSPTSSHNSNIEITYPVIVCSSFASLYRIDVAGNASPAQLSNNFLFELHYAYPITIHDRPAPRRDSKSEYFLVDVISFENLNAFVATLDHEVNEGIHQIL